LRCVAILDHDIQKKLIKAAHDNTALRGSISQISSEVHLGPGDVHALSATAVASHRVCTFSSKANNRNIGIMAKADHADDTFLSLGSCASGSRGGVGVRTRGEKIEVEEGR